MLEPAFVSIAIGICQIVAFVGGGAVVAYRVGRTAQRLDQFVDLHGTAIGELRLEVHALKVLMTEVAVQKHAIERLQKDYDEIRKELFIPPLSRGFGTKPS